jgi:acyl-CoA thioester hydrolase
MSDTEGGQGPGYDRRVFQPGHVTDRRPPFRFAVYTRVGFSDTDAQGVVYYGRYLPYFDLAQTEYHRNLADLPVAGVQFVTRALQVEYHAPARFDDLIEVFARVARIGQSSMTFEYAAYDLTPGADEPLMVTASQVFVLIDHDDRRTLPIPDAFRARVSAFEGVAL